MAALYILGHIYPEKTGGMEIFNYYFLKQQSENSQDVVYYLSSCSIDNLRSVNIPMSIKKPIRLFYGIQLFRTIFRLRKRIRYVYLSYAPVSWVIPFVISVACSIFNVPYIITIHSGESPMRRFMYPYRIFFKKAYAVVGVSETICAEYGKFFRIKKLLFIPPLIPFENQFGKKQEIREQLGITPDEHMLLFVGALSDIKNPGTVIRAFKQLGHELIESNKLKLVFAGNGELMDTLKEEVVANKLEKYVSFVGTISRDQMPLYYVAADFYITASDYEGTSIALLEAMFHRLPIIAADAPGLNRMIKHNCNGLLFKPKDENALANTINRLLDDPEFAKLLGQQAGRDYLQNYSYQGMINDYETLFSAAKNL